MTSCDIVPIGTNQGALASAINREHDAAQASASTAVEHAMRCGKLLMQAKAEVGHGGFMAWIKKHTNISQDLANRYMRVAHLEGPNSERVLNMSLRKALSSLPRPKGKTGAPSKADRAKTTSKPSDLDAKRIIKQLAAIKQKDLTDPAWFAGQLHFHASRLNPLKAAI